MYSWRTDVSGLVVVSKDGAPEFVPSLQGANADGMDRVLAQWSELAETVATQWNVPKEWLLAMIWRESGGNPKALRHEPNGWTGVGILQITHPALKAGLSDEQLMDPQANMQRGARYLAKQLIPAYDHDFPKISAAYNSGSVRFSSENEWQMRCTGSHIDAEVAALNYQILKARDDLENVMRVQFDLTADLDILKFSPSERDTEPDRGG